MALEEIITTIVKTNSSPNYKLYRELAKGNGIQCDGFQANQDIYHADEEVSGNQEIEKMFFVRKSENTYSTEIEVIIERLLNVKNQESKITNYIVVTSSAQEHRWYTRPFLRYLAWSFSRSFIKKYKI